MPKIAGFHVCKAVFGLAGILTLYLGIDSWSFVSSALKTQGTVIRSVKDRNYDCGAHENEQCWRAAVGYQARGTKCQVEAWGGTRDASASGKAAADRGSSRPE